MTQVRKTIVLPSTEVADRLTAEAVRLKMGFSELARLAFYNYLSAQSADTSQEAEAHGRSEDNS